MRSPRRSKYRPTPELRRETVEPIPSYLNSNRKVKTEVVKPHSLLHDPACRELRNSLFKNNTSLNRIDTPALVKLVGHLREYSSFCGMQRFYEKAKRADELLERVKAELMQRETPVEREDSREMEILKQKRRDMRERNTWELKEFDRETKEKRSQLEATHEHRVSEFELVWRDDMPRKYRKPSQKLLTLMGAEKQYARQGKYDQAQRVQREVDALTEKEATMAQARLIADYKEAKAKLMAKIKEEADLFEDTRAHLRDIIVQRQKLELEPLKNRKLVVEQRKSKSGADAKEEQIEGNVAGIMRHFAEGETALLPQLVAPNDERVKQAEEQVLRRKKERGRNIKRHLMEKDHAADRSTDSSDSGDYEIVKHESKPKPIRTYRS